jgi:hypothetical protein
MTPTTEADLYQLACRGALELPNDPFKAVNNIRLSETRASKMRSADRAKARKGILYDAFLAQRYENA